MNFTPQDMVILEGTEGTACSDAGLRGSPDKKAEGTGGTAIADVVIINPLDMPPDDELQEIEDKKRPYFENLLDWMDYGNGKLKPGLWYFGTDKDNYPFQQWICSPISCEAVTASEGGDNFGRLLRFMTTDGKWREWAAPMHMLKGSGEDMRGELLSAGAVIDSSSRARNMLNNWVLQQNPKRRVIAATSTGWHGNELFIMPRRNIGHGDAVYQSEHAAHEVFAERGTLQGWNDTIGLWCMGNPLLLLSVSASLAGVLLQRTHRQGGGFHLVGDSSSGKSTAMLAAASVWGAPDRFVRTWRATGNGLEGVAAAHNDTCLILDEIGESSPHEVGSIVYSIGNGTGKTRAGRTGAARATQRWRLMLLSSGERTLAAHMSEAGKTALAGQQARLLDIPIWGRHGAFDDLHGCADGREFSDTVKTSCSQNYGHLGLAFIERVIKDGRDFAGKLAAVASLPQFKSENGLEGRAATSFALVGMAGELAIEYGLVPWVAGDALQAAIECYQAWRAHRGHGQTETKQILRAVNDFIAKHGDSRFSYLSDNQSVVRDRAGWWRDDNDDRVYLFSPAGLREATKGYDFKRVLTALDESGWIVERDTDKRTKKTKVAGKAMGLYVIGMQDVGGDL
ncbi:MAG: DUF927 domain-containing protein [Halothiobacillaceae bacterium]|nr:DUF927 domain-containing protein [Halothiobacillaceae bacterium]